MFGKNKTEVIKIDNIPTTELILATPPSLPTLYFANGVTAEDVTKDDFYVKEVYCCNCSHHHFKIAIRKGLISVGAEVPCPNCNVLGVVNGHHQVWPKDSWMSGK